MRIEHRTGGVVTGKALLYANGKYRCHAPVRGAAGLWFGTLEQVAAFLRATPGSGVRMTPDCSEVSDDIYIDGIPR